MSVSNYTEPRIVASNDLKTRSYILFYFNGKRIREYNGKSLNLKVQPNYAGSIHERDKLLRKLQFEFLKALENNAYPALPESTASKLIEENPKTTTALVLAEALKRKQDSKLAKYYKRNLESIYSHFIAFLKPEELNADITRLKRQRIEEFLNRFKSSGTYYMNKRRDLGVLFASAGKSIDFQLRVVQETETMRSKAKLHLIYEDKQLAPILKYLKHTHPNLYLCCLITYGCFLRPHEEVRKLYVHHFKKDFTEIHLSGDENKGSRVRVVNVPEYVRKELLGISDFQDADVNLFSRRDQVFNDAYFNTAWTRAWSKMNKLGLIQLNQTIYSFRHTAAVQVYRKTKDVHLLQQLLGHSDMIVTMKYLRGLGELNNEQLKDAMPELTL